MFNRQPFNKGKFNIQNLDITSNSGIGMLLLVTEPVQAQKIVVAGGQAGMRLNQDAQAVVVKYDQGRGEMEMGASAEPVVVHISQPEIAIMKMSSEATYSRTGESIASFDNLILKPGEELILNTCDMTIMINKQNGMEYFGVESEFFNLLPGINELVYSDKSPSRKISFDVIWKDKWL